MMKNTLLFLLLSFLPLFPSSSRAQGAAPEMYGVREVVIENIRFDEQQAADNCGLSREHIATALDFAFKNSNVPVIDVADIRPQSLGVARIQLIPEISTYANESLDCVSWVSLSAENRVNAVIPPIPTLRSATVVYWRQHTRVVSGQSVHEQKIIDTLQKMAGQFIQQYHIDQPPEPAKSIP